MKLAKNIMLFGAPETPYFEPDTINRIYASTPTIPQKSYTGRIHDYYRCPYCEMDARVQTNNGALHVREHTQIDHKIPFSRILNTNAYDAYIPQFITAGLAAWGATAVNWNDPAQVQVIYNDLDNLWITCTNHNQEKRAQPHFHQKMVMGIGNLLNKQ